MYRIIKVRGYSDRSGSWKPVTLWTIGELKGTYWATVGTDECTEPEDILALGEIIHVPDDEEPL